MWAKDRREYKESLHMKECKKSLPERGMADACVGEGQEVQGVLT